MLGTRTKQIFSYGRRNQRVVNVYEERDKKDPFSPQGAVMVPRAPVAARTRKREDCATLSESEAPPARTVRIRSKKKQSSPLQDSQTFAEKQTRGQATIESDTIVTTSTAPSPERAFIDHPLPSRRPLSAYPVNIPGSSTRIKKGKVRKKGKANEGTPFSLKTSSPFVDVEILILDGDGRRISQERRVSRTDIIMNPINADNTVENARTRSADGYRENGEDTFDSDDDVQPRPARRVVRRAKAITIISDESDASDTAPLETSPYEFNDCPVQSDSSDSPVPMNPPSPIDSTTPPPESTPANKPLQSALSFPLESGLSDMLIPLAISPPPRASHHHPLRHHFRSLMVTPPAIPRTRLRPRFPSPRPRPRQLTPMRNGAGARSLRLFERPPLSSPSTLTDSDLSLECSVDLDLDIGTAPSGLPQLDGKLANAGLCFEPPPEYLMPLLTECDQEESGPHEFSAFIEMFPVDPIVWDARDKWMVNDARFRKIGEASYSEVFGIGDVVLKIIPLRDETPNGRAKGPTPTQAWSKSKSKSAVAYGNAPQEREERDGPPPSDAKDVLKEMIVTRAMGDICDGFVKLLRTYVVRGRYPERLLKLWDDFFERKGSENVRPDTFSVSQVYAIIVLPNGGPDLEAYKFTNGKQNGWRQACSLFWQVARALARAEQLVSFEHRDLHWGQILVRNIPWEISPLKVRKTTPGKKAKLITMDQLAYGVRATIIDLGLSRMDAADGAGGEHVHWTPLADEIFMGEGDYQFDIYRIMKEHTHGAWEEFKPLTNVMWLHYLTHKLLYSKQLKPPAKSPPSSTPVPTGFTEQYCHDCLIEIENVMSQCVNTVKPKTLSGRRGKTRTPVPGASKGPQSASEVVEYAVKKGWLH